MAVSKEKIHKELPFVETASNLRVSYNIAPTQHAYIITNDSPSRLQYVTWGLIPYWSKDGKASGKMINARKEGIESKPSFRVPIRKRKCLVLADSFYEWRMEGKQKVPYRIFLKNEDLILMAGIWDVWLNGNYMVKSFSIITTPPNQEMSSIHNRMPVILTSPQKRELWLTSNNLDESLNLLETPDDGILDRYRVSEKIGKVKYDSVDLHREVPETPTLF